MTAAEADQLTVDPRFDGVVRADGPAGLRAALLPTLHPGDSHAATLLEMPSGDLICAWFNGPKEGEPDTNIVLSRLPKGDSVWTTPMRMSADPERSEQNPVLFTPGGDTVWLLHTSNEPHDQTTSRVLRRVSTDGGHTFAPATVVFEEAGTFLRTPIVVLSNGDWLIPAYHCRRGGEFSAVKISTDNGESWQEYDVPDSAGRVQMSVVETEPGRLLAMFRSRDADRIYESRSDDHGRTWTAPVRTPLPNNNSAIQLLRLDGGDLMLVFNDASGERDQFRWVPDGDGLRRKTVRTPLTLAVSKDGGRTWPHLRNLQVQDEEYLDNQFGYSYPAMLQAADGSVHVAYSFLRKTIRHVVLDPSWVEAGSR